MKSLSDCERLRFALAAVSTDFLRHVNDVSDEARSGRGAALIVLTVGVLTKGGSGHTEPTDLTEAALQLLNFTRIEELRRADLADIGEGYPDALMNNSHATRFRSNPMLGSADLSNGAAELLRRARSASQNCFDESSLYPVIENQPHGLPPFRNAHESG